MKKLSGAPIVALASTVLASTVLAPVMATHAYAEETKIEEVVVFAYPVIIENSATPVEAPPAADGADFLRRIPGVSAGRFGGHSLEPYIRGLSQTQLTVLHDGALQMGSGPNRMDTPSTYATIDLVDQVIVHRGYQSVLNGPSAVGGTISYERNIPTYNENLWTSAKLGASYEGNGGVERAFGRASVGKGSLVAEGWYSIHGADNYQDGDGKDVRSAFKDKAAGGSFTFLDPANNYLQFTYSHNKMTDALFPGAGMDSVLSGGDTIGVKGLFAPESSLFEEVRLIASFADTDHVMNNFALRPNAGMLVETKTSSNTYNAELEFDINAGGEITTLAINYRDITNNGTRYTGMMPSAVNVSTGIVWPEINTQQYGIALQQTRAIANDVNLTMGVRSDWTKVSFGRENIAPDMGLMGMMPMTANMLYNQFYGISATDVSEHALSGLLKIEWQTNNNINVYGVVSRSNRTADATERGFANQMIMNGNNSSWIGNPGIASENHNQFEVGMLKIGSNWSFGFSAFLDMVDDFILRDSARGQDGIVMTAPMADVYRNINAKIMGFEMQTQWQISDNVSLHGDIAYSYGQDRDRGEPLAQIPPLQGNIILQTNIADISLTTGMRFAFDQERVDTNPMMGTGRDLSTDTSYAVFDITAHYDLSDAVRLQAGVRNLLDLQYADHLNRSNLLDATEVQVNEPGRSAYAKIVASF